MFQRPRDQKENIPPPRPAPEPSRKESTPDVGLIGKLGTYEKHRQKLQEERKREYNEMIAGVSGLRKREYNEMIAGVSG